MEGDTYSCLRWEGCYARSWPRLGNSTGFPTPALLARDWKHALGVLLLAAVRTRDTGRATIHNPISPGDIGARIHDLICGIVPYFIGVCARPRQAGQVATLGEAGVGKLASHDRSIAPVYSGVGPYLIPGRMTYPKTFTVAVA
jgi:hypothetical protein